VKRSCWGWPNSKIGSSSVCRRSLRPKWKRSAQHSRRACWTRHQGSAKRYRRLLVDEIRLEGNELKVRGSYRKLADALGLMERTKLGEVPSFMPEWRAGEDSNLRPLIQIFSAHDCCIAAPSEQCYLRNTGAVDGA